MKRIIRSLLCLMLLAAMLLSTVAVPAMAVGGYIEFTQNSSSEVGKTVTVDTTKTRNMINRYGTPEQYNAYIEGNVQYYWMRNGTYYADGPRLTITEQDRGCQFYCIAALYRDEERTQQCGSFSSRKFTVAGSPTIPEITTQTLPDGTEGEAYYQKLECTDPDVVYSLLRSSLPDGLTLTQHGEIEGTPTKAGMWHVVVMVTPEGGADYANTKEFDITIAEKGPEYTLEVMEVPKKIVYTSGEKLDMTGLWVRIYTPDGFIDSYDGQYLTYTKNALVTVGEQKIKLTYKDAFGIFIVTVKAAPSHVHKNNLTKVNAKEADCTTDGNIAYYACSCGKYFKDASASAEITDKNSVIVKAGHTYGTGWDYKDADGHAHVCKCGAKDEVQVHTPDIAAPTETADQKCTVCGYVMAAKTGTGSSSDPTSSTVPPSSDPTSSERPDDEPKPEKFSMPWWGTTLIATAAAGVGAVVALVIPKKKKL